MDKFTTSDLQNLIERYSDWVVSIYMPAHRRGRDTEQDPIRLKNLLRQAEERLLAKGMRSPEVRAMLGPAQNLLQQAVFWRHQSDGLALFIDAQGCRSYRLPLPFEELVVISQRFHLKPLLPFFAGDGHFYILALSQNNVRLLEGTRHTVDEIEQETLPSSMAEALQFERFEKTLQFHTGATGGGDRRPAMFHGHDASDEAKDKILRWFHKLDAELTGLLADEQSPLVLAGVEYLLPIYRQANSYPYLMEQGVEGNPEELKPEKLHERAWPFVEPVFIQARQDAAARYAQLASSDQATTDLEQALRAAHHGRVEVLFVALGEQVWGVDDPANDRIEIHQKAEAGDEDLLDLAALYTMQTGGTVFALARDQVPEQALLAALYRY